MLAMMAIRVCVAVYVCMYVIVALELWVCWCLSLSFSVYRQYLE